MHLTSKNTSLLILGITAIACSKALFFSFNDPEGANLLIVTILALVVFLSSVLIYRLNSSPLGLKKLLIALFVQVLIVIGLYFFLR